MKVYLLVHSVDYEGDYPLGIFSTKELVEKYKKDNKLKDNTCGYHTFEIQEYEVDNPNYEENDDKRD